MSRGRFLCLVMRVWVLWEYLLSKNAVLSLLRFVLDYPGLQSNHKEQPITGPNPYVAFGVCQSAYYSLIDHLPTLS
jgi:hypothetical protein